MSVNPFLIRIFGDFGIQWSGVLFLLAILFAMTFARWMLKRQKAGISTEIQWNFLFYSIWGALIGGRVGYCLFFSPDLFIKFRASAPYWGFLAINEGGLSLHGALLGLMIVGFVIAMRNHLSSLPFLDLIGITLPVGIFWGRIAQFLNSENIGRETSSGSFLAYKFPAEIKNWPSENLPGLQTLAEVYERISAGEKEAWVSAAKAYNESVEAKNFINEGVGQIMQKIGGGDQTVLDSLLPLLPWRYPAALYAALSEGLILFLILFLMWKRPKPTGLIFSMFLILFSVFRLINESYQDASSRATTLSAVTLLGGLTLLFLSSRTTSVQTPGWGRVLGVKLHRK